MAAGIVAVRAIVWGTVGDEIDPQLSAVGDHAPRRPGWWLLGGLAVVAVVCTMWQAATWPSVGALLGDRPHSTAFIERYEERESKAGRKPRVDWRWVSYAAISNDLKRSVVVAEDIDFFSHRGFATAEIEKAVREAWEEKELPRGASTITQQLAKNLYLSPSRNPWRKVKEALLTRQLERTLPKRRILELYLNVVEFGPGIYGAEAAARRYFGLSAAGLDALQAAQLAAVLPKPSSWRPGSPSRVYQARVTRILRRAEQSRWLDREI